MIDHTELASPIPTAEEFQGWMQKTEIPLGLYAGITNWTLHGIEPGSFLRAIIQNDLMRAVVRADATNLKLLPEIVMGLMTVAPSAAWMTPDALVNWPQYIKARRRQEEEAKP